VLYPNEADHIISWLACRLQRPGVKINHALFLGGAPKIGKDTLLEAVVYTFGTWNVKNVKLNHLVSRNNEFLKALIVRLCEVRDVGEPGAADLYRLNDHMKDMLATPPDTLRINEKYINEYYILNRAGRRRPLSWSGPLLRPISRLRPATSARRCRRGGRRSSPTTISMPTILSCWRPRPMLGTE
jgi:hypothetical protein